MWWLARTVPCRCPPTGPALAAVSPAPAHDAAWRGTTPAKAGGSRGSSGANGVLKPGASAGPCRRSPAATVADTTNQNEPPRADSLFCTGTDKMKKINISILDYGLQKNIVISTPGTLFSIIKTVELSFTREQLNKRAIEFERNAHQLINIAENFIKSFNDIELRIKQLHQSYKNIGTKVEGKQGLIRHLRTIAKGVGRELVKTTINEKDTDDKK